MLNFTIYLNLRNWKYKNFQKKSSKKKKNKYNKNKNKIIFFYAFKNIIYKIFLGHENLFNKIDDYFYFVIINMKKIKKIK